MSALSMDIVLLPAISVSGELAGYAAALHQRCFDPGWNGAAFQSLLGSPGVSLILAQQAGDRDQLAGLLLARAVADEAEILTLCVDSRHRGKGIGVQLVNRMIADLGKWGTKAYFLEVAQTNHVALKLYEQCGFQMIGHREAYYADGQTAVTMCRANKV